MKASSQKSVLNASSVDLGELFLEELRGRRQRLQELVRLVHEEAERNSAPPARLCENTHPCRPCKGVSAERATSRANPRRGSRSAAR